MGDKPEQGKAALQLVARLQKYFNRWTEMAKCKKKTLLIYQNQICLSDNSFSILV